MNKDRNLFWVDVETTGLDRENAHILEIASLVTDSELNLVAEGPDIVIRVEEEVLNKVSEVVRDMHVASGLWAKVRQAKMTLAEAEEQTLKFLTENCGFKKSPYCGNTVGFDKEMLRIHMTRIGSYLHYRTIDVTTVAELAKRWYPRIKPFDRPKGTTALDDCKNAMEELKYYRDQIFVRA